MAFSLSSLLPYSSHSPVFFSRPPLHLHRIRASLEPYQFSGLSSSDRNTNLLNKSIWINPNSPLIATLQTLKSKRERIYFNIELKNLSNLGSWDDAESLLLKMIEKGIKPDNITIATLISCARVCNLPSKAAEWFDRMPEFGLTPDCITYSAMIDAYCIMGNADLAFGLYARAQAENHCLLPAAFIALIGIHESSGNYEGALLLFEEMKTLRVKLNLASYNRMLEVMGKAGWPWQVKSIYKEMIDNGFTPNKITFHAFIKSCCKAHYATDALNAYQEMKKMSLTPSLVLYNMLLFTCADFGLLDEAVGISKDMNGLQDSRSFSSLITAYSCSGDVAGAERTLHEMVEAGFRPTIFVLTSIVKCYGKAGRIDDIVRTLKQVSESSVLPDDRFCACLLNVLAWMPKENGGESERMLECIERCNPKLASFVRLMINVGASEKALEKEAEELLGGIGEEVKKAYLNCLIDVCMNWKQNGRASLLFRIGTSSRIYPELQSKEAERWWLDVRGLSHGAAVVALRSWTSDMKGEVEKGEELPAVVGIFTGHGKHRHYERGLAVAFEGHLREMNAPFHENGEKVGCFLATGGATKSWLEDRAALEVRV